MILLCPERAPAESGATRESFGHDIGACLENPPQIPGRLEEMRQWSALLEQELSSWPQVTLRPMFGLTGVYRKEKIFGILPRTKAFETPSSVAFKIHRPTSQTAKLLKEDERLMITKGKRAGWITFEVNSAVELRNALKWFDLAYRNCLSRNNSKP